jgi:uncharacterized protein (TIGR02302 family)
VVSSGRERGSDPLTDQPRPYDVPMRHLARPVALTRAGMLAERAVRAFWPFWSVLFVALTPLMMGWLDAIPLELFWGSTVFAVLGLLASLVWGVTRFRWPSRDEAVARVDAAMPGRPIAALADSQAIGADDPASNAVWAAHLRRMAERTKSAKAVEPDLRVSSRDPYGLRYMALILFVTALLFGSLWRVGSVTEVATTGEQVLATGPVWEGWIEPPAYTGRPSLYLADIPQGPLAVPQGSTVTLRLYGDVGSLTVAETVSGRTGDIPSASEAQQAFEVVQDGKLAIHGEGGAEWIITLIPDLPPKVELSGPVDADAMGEMSQPFMASDDFGVMSGTATIALDLPSVTRSFGLVTEPDLRAPIVIDLPMPFTGDRKEFEEKLIENFSEHPFANMPVTISLTATDASGQVTTTSPEQMVLPGRRFFEPMARAVVEQRRYLLWSRANAPEVVQLLRAVSYKPEDIFANEQTYLRLSFIIRDLENASDNGTLTVEKQDEIAKAMWDLAVQLEDGTLADARERLRRAQERLAEAMRNGASNEEIAELMQELREATNDYLNMLAQNAEPGEDQTDQPNSAQDQSRQVTQDEIQALMDRIQELMEEGRMAEAAELMAQLDQLMQNLQVTQGENGNGNGPRTPGQQSMQDLQDTLRDQQDLSDDAFRDLQNQFNQPQDGQQPGQQDGQQQDGQQQGQQGQQPGQQEGDGLGQGGDPQNGEQGGNGMGNERQPEGGDGGQNPQSLADRQQALRGELERQRGNLPGLTGDQAEAARRALEQAEGAMDQAEEALRDGRMAEAIDQQSEAMDALREGLRNLGEALAQNDAEPGQGEQADGSNAQARTEPTRRDPLGRETGNNSGRYGTDENMLQGADIYRRAEELLDDIRKRAAEQDRPTLELDYLKRLLEQF